MPLLPLSLLGLLPLLLPWIHLPTIGTVYGWESGWAYYSSLAFLTAFLLNAPKEPKGLTLAGIGLCGVIGAGIAGVYIAVMTQMIRDFQERGDLAERAVGIGPWVAVIAGVGMVGVCLWKARPRIMEP